MPRVLLQRWKRLWSVIILGIFLTIICIEYRRTSKAKTIDSAFPMMLKATNENKFVLRSSTCNIEDLDPFSEEAMKSITLIRNPIKCSRNEPLTYVHGSDVIFNETVLDRDYKGRIGKCWYKTISRKSEGPSYIKIDFNMSKPILIDNWRSVRISSEFIYLYCQDVEGKFIYKQYHSVPDFIPQLKAKKKMSVSHDPEPSKYNVILIGTDSLSRSNVLRQMPKSRQYMIEKLGATEMKGYTKVNDNTLVNIVPLLTGKHLTEAFEGKDPFDSKDTFFDDVPLHFLWSKYSQKGYYTAYVEDEPKIAIFHDMHSGFRKQPTDYYNRPLVLAMEADQSLHHGKCIGPKLAVQYQLDYIKDIIIKHKADDFFLFSFTSCLTHKDNANGAGYLDPIYLSFFQELEAKGIWENTIMIFFGDHGSRYGTLPQTPIGRKEVRLPALYISLPSKFKKAYPEFFQNLLINSNRLTSPFDIHQTLQHITDLSSEDPNLARGISLFQEIPDNRNCAGAGISPEWCMCNQYSQIATSEGIVVKAADVIVGEVNKRIQSDSQGKLCAALMLSSIVDAFLLEKTDSEKETFEQAYRISIRTIPGNAHFDAHIVYDQRNGDLRVVGLITRQTSYQDQSLCIKHPITKLYCYCKSS